jgi:hypothetical protein
MRRITSGLISPASRKDKTASRSAASSSRRQPRQSLELLAYWQTGVAAGGHRFGNSRGVLS